MAEFPFMPFYWSDSMSKTVHLSTEEHGAYVLILATMWMHGGTLPDDDVKLARIARLSLGKWRRMAPTIRAFLTECDGALTQKRLQDERKKSLEISGKRSANAKARWNAKSLESNDAAYADAYASGYANGDATAMQTACETDAISYLHNTVEDISPPSPSCDAQPADDLDAEFADWWAHYPRKLDRLKALKAYRAARRKGVTADELKLGVMRYAAECDRNQTQPNFIKHGASWLNAGSWENAPTPPARAASPPVNPMLKALFSGLDPEAVR